MNPERIDLNLLVVLSAVLQEGNVTRASKRLGMSQPAVSSAINRLRDVLGDPLFVRTNRGVIPTARARELAPRLDQALGLVREIVHRQSRFDPLQSDRRFKILMLDIGEMNLLPKLLGHIRGIGARISLETEQLAGEAQAAALETGAADLALGGNWPHLSAERGFCRKRLFTDSFVCLLGAKHPPIAGAMTTKAYMSASHLVVGGENWINNPIDTALMERGLTRNVALRVPHYLPVPMILAQSDLIVGMPARPAHIFARRYRFRVAALPFAVPAFEVSQYWHNRFDGDPGVKWMVETVDHLLSDA